MSARPHKRTWPKRQSSGRKRFETTPLAGHQSVMSRFTIRKALPAVTLGHEGAYFPHPAATIHKKFCN